MICPKCRYTHVKKTYCPRIRKPVWMCPRCNATWEIKNDYGYSDDDDDSY